jgi:NAD(P)-dependent dehydrogenase (short-subunit alcohol dehydrogenase family)
MAEISSEPPSRGLKGKVAIVTGAGCAGDGIGNGRAISIMLADEGCNVLCLDLNLEWAQKTAKITSSKPGRATAIAVKGDVTQAADCDSAVQLALEKFGRLDILVNNVGIGGAPGTAVGRYGSLGQGVGDQCQQYGANGKVRYTGDAEE